MRTLQFKITVDSLILRFWDEWKREDQDYIRKEAAKQNLSFWIEEQGAEMVFKGNHEQMFSFLYMIAYRYDIELI